MLYRHVARAFLGFSTACSLMVFMKQLTTLLITRHRRRWTQETKRAVFQEWKVVCMRVRVRVCVHVFIFGYADPTHSQKSIYCDYKSSHSQKSVSSDDKFRDHVE